VLELIARAYFMGAFCASIAHGAAGQTLPSSSLPGKGLAQHDFLYAGESPDRKIFLVRQGKIVWSYDDPTGKGEISDAVMLSNGNVLFAHQFGVTEITPEKKRLCCINLSGTQFFACAQTDQAAISKSLLTNWISPSTLGLHRKQWRRRIMRMISNPLMVA